MDNNTNKKLSDAIHGAIHAYVDSVEKQGPIGSQEVAAGYVSGMAQALHFLIKHDGKYTPHQLLKAAVDCGIRLGLVYQTSDYEKIEPEE